MLLFFCQQFLLAQNTETQQFLENYINQTEKNKTPEQIKKEYLIFNQQAKPEIKSYLEVVYLVVFAQKESELKGKINKLSEENFLKALKKSENIKDPGFDIWLNVQFGFYYYHYNELVKALPYYLKADQLMEEVNPKDIFQNANTLKYIGYYFGETLDYTKCIDYLKIALEILPENTEESAEIMNNIGSYYWRNGDFTEAKKYIEQSREQSKKYGYNVRYAKTLGDLAQIHLHQNEFEKAEKLLKEDIRISQAEKSDRNTMFAQILLSKLYIKTNELEKSKEILANVESYVKDKYHLKTYEKDIAEQRLNIAIEEDDLQSELQERRKIDSLSVYFSGKDGKEAINKVNFEAQKSKIQQQLNKEKVKSKKQSLFRWVMTISSFLLIALLIVNYFVHKKKRKNQEKVFDEKVENFKNEKLFSEQKLTETNNTLNAYKIYLSEKNRQIASLEKEIEKNKFSTESINNKQQQSLYDLLDSHLMTEEYWLHFKKTFIKEQPAYFEYLNHNFPDLTESNLRIVILQKMNLNNTEIANILGITIGAVKKAKQRLQKKYNEKYDELTKFN